MAYRTSSGSLSGIRQNCERGAISIGRRLQDPLAELVKVDPKAIGAGQYQHDVSQPLLGAKLDEVVVSCVNGVGVELNTASAPGAPRAKREPRTSFGPSSGSGGFSCNPFANL